jgi:hypothetical protein
MTTDGFHQIFGETLGTKGGGEVLSLGNLSGYDPVRGRGRRRLNPEKSFLTFREARFLPGRPEEISPQEESDGGKNGSPGNPVFFPQRGRGVLSLFPAATYGLNSMFPPSAEYTIGAVFLARGKGGRRK